jgi:nucleoside-triphosphatase
MRRMFLTGPIGCGKSTLIRTVFGDHLGAAGGFVTERILEGGELVGFDLVSPGTSVGRKLLHLHETVPGLYEKDGHLRLRFLTFKGGEVRRNDEAFSVFASALLREAGTKPFAVLDEIGGFEILIPEFMEAFERFLETQVPCVGVLKSLPSGEKLSKTVGLDPKYVNAAERLHARLASDPETEIAEISGYEDKQAMDQLSRWKDQYLRQGEPK